MLTPLQHIGIWLGAIVVGSVVFFGCLKAFGGETTKKRAIRAAERGLW